MKAMARHLGRLGYLVEYSKDSATRERAARERVVADLVRRGELE
jgi:hypothetical protein